LKVGTLKDWIVSDIYTHSYCRQLTAVKINTAVAIQNSCSLFIMLYTQ